MSEQTKTEKDKVWSIVRTSLLAFGAGVGGFLLNDLLSFREDNRELLRSEYSDVQSAFNDLNKNLLVFLDQARGRATAKQDDIEQFRISAMKLNDEVSDLVRREPSLREPGAVYGNALVELVSSVEEFEDPYRGGKPFIEDLGKFKEASDAFDDAVAEKQTSWWF